MSFFDELKRRNVIRVGLAYIVVGWLTAQVAEFATENFGAPDWVLKIFVVFLILGLPFVLIFAWAFEMTPEGIKKEKDVDRSQSITRKTGRKLDFTIIGMLVLVAAYFVWESRFSEKGPDTFSGLPTEQTSQVTDQKMYPAPFNKDNSIAVLPFANRSNVDDDLFFTDGIHDDLLTQLAKINDLKVISRTSVMEYRDTTKKIPEIAKELGVATILEGGIQRAGNRIRINAQLIDVATDEHLWAETFDREMTIENIFDIQSEITRQIVNAVRGELSDEESEVLAQLPTHSLEAYEAYLHARTFLNHPDFTREKFEDAQVWLEKAIEFDPEFALGWVLLVTTNSQAIWQGYDDSPERLLRVREALSNATQYGPFLPETLAARAEYLYRIENNFQEAEIAFRTASKAKPGDADMLLSLALAQRRTGKWEQSVSNFQLAIELDPENTEVRTQMVGTLMSMRESERAGPLINSWIEKYPEAMDIKGYKFWLLIQRDGDLIAARNWFDQIESSSGTPWYAAATQLPFLERDYQAAIDIYDHPQFSDDKDEPWFRPSMLVAISSANMHMGNSQVAEESAQQAIRLLLGIESTNDANNAFNLQTLAIAYAQSGDLVKALEAANQSCALIPESRDSNYGPLFSSTRAMILAMSGQRDEALVEIERLLSTPRGLFRWWLYLHPDWDFFRDDERFNELIKPENVQEVGP